MKAILEFNLPEDQESFYNAQNAGAFVSTIRDTLNRIRSKLKYGEITEEERKILEEMKSVIFESLSGIEIW